jgi:phosphohistidine phosphatase SixA
MEAHRAHGPSRLRHRAPRLDVCAAALLAAAAFRPAEALAQKAVFVVRHAEKESESNEKGTPLSKAGAEHAARLAELLKGAGVTAIYATDTVRARQTGEPLAQMLKLTIKTYEPRDARGTMTPQPLLDLLKANEKDGIVLVVGHSNTVPDVLTGLGAKESVKIATEDYRDVYLLVPRPADTPLLLRFRF